MALGDLPVPAALGTDAAGFKGVPARAAATEPARADPAAGGLGPPAAERTVDSRRHHRGAPYRLVSRAAPWSRRSCWPPAPAPCVDGSVRRCGSVAPPQDSPARSEPPWT